MTFARCQAIKETDIIIGVQWNSNFLCAMPSPYNDGIPKC